MVVSYYLQRVKTLVGMVYLDDRGDWGGTMGENHSFWLLKRFLIFQGISGDLDANLLKHISLKIQ